MAKNPFSKSRWIDQPYAIYVAHGWEWRVLKTYKLADNEKKDAYARWFVGAKSPHTYGEFELGDTYAKEVLMYGRLKACTEEWLAAHGDRGVRADATVEILN